MAETVHQETAVGLEAPEAAVLAEAPVAVGPEGVVVPVVAAVLEVAEGQAAGVPVEIDKVQSWFSSTIECIRKKGGHLRPDERFRKTVVTFSRCSQSLIWAPACHFNVPWWPLRAMNI
jgi:hypothetical protein